MKILFGTRGKLFVACEVEAHAGDILTTSSLARFQREKLLGEAAVITLLTLLTHVSHGAPPSSAIDVSRLANLPDPHGVAAPFVGVAGDALVVAGGTNFPDAPPWKNGTKTWHNAAYVLPSVSAQWQTGFKLSRRAAYGISLTTNAGVLCIGGCDEKSNFDDVFMLRWDGKNLTQHKMASLPHPTSCAAGAMIGSRVYVAGGQAGPNPASGPSYSFFWMLDLDQDSQSWRELPTWPGPERFYAIAGSDGQSFFLFSGIRRTEDKKGQPQLEYLKDAYRFDPMADEWRRLADLPHANAAIATPAPYANGGLFLLGRGADGAGADVPLDQRRPFAREILRYDVAADKFETVGTLPFGLAAVSSTQWNGSFIIASGESRPGVRSPNVWSIRPASLTDGSR
jgi:N-acetylneuraminic acid mutarotase